MAARQVAGVVAAVLLFGAGLLLLWALGVLVPILVFLGLGLFLLVVVGTLVFVVLTVVLAPYYYLTKRAEVRPGRYELDDVEEK